MDFKKFMTTDAGWGMFCLRIVTGIIFIGHGLPKFGWIGDRTLAGTAGFLESIGVPMPMAGAFLVAFFETFGGAFLVIGLMACSLALMFEGAGKASLDRKLTS